MQNTCHEISDTLCHTLTPAKVPMYLNAIPIAQILQLSLRPRSSHDMILDHPIFAHFCKTHGAFWTEGVTIAGFSGGV